LAQDKPSKQSAENEVKALAATTVMARTVFFLAFCLFTGLDARFLTPTVAPKAPAKTVAATPTDVLALHKQLDTIAGKLETMLNAKDGALAHAKVGPAMKVFLKELQGVLKATADTKMAPAMAIAKLTAAKQGLAGLMGDLSNRQETLMKEDNTQRESLLLGVLITKQKEPMDVQLKILADEDFAGLEVAKALVAKHDSKTALYVQAATYLDAHPKRKSAPMVVEKAVDPREKMQAVLEKHLASLEHEFEVRTKVHEKKVAEFATRLAKSSKTMQHSVKIRQKREEREFKKFAAMRKHDIAAMKDAVEGIKKGDMKAVARARTALQESLKAMQSQTGGFLYLIQLGHRMEERDCPYCAAQCVDKCHSAGNPYVKCMTDCADAGK
jgi:hypothetical protein